MRAEHLYVHVPFCARRCVYCDFSIAVRARVPEEEYVAALAAELRLRHANSDLRLSTLYFGGGTPSKLSPGAIQRLVDAVRTTATIADDAEVTLEANPEDVTREAASAWAQAGINRVSLGVQSFSDRVLAWMHRTHDAASARVAIEVLRDAGLANLSIDLIFALPESLGRDWREDLGVALALEVPHLSVYGLTVEPHTPLGRWVARSSVSEAPEQRFESEFLAGDALLTADGFEHYEVSNYAKPGMRSRHNSAYWTRRPYAGLGPSAHEFTGQCRRWNVAPYASWLQRLGAGLDPVEGVERIDDEQRAAEDVYLGLRTSSGLALFTDEQAHVMRWIDAGWAQLDDKGVLRLTPTGWLRLDALSADLTHLRSR